MKSKVREVLRGIEKMENKNLFYLIDRECIMMIMTDDKTVKSIINKLNRKRRKNITMFNYGKNGEQIRQDIEKSVEWKKVKCSVHYLKYFLNLAEMVGAEWVEIAVEKEKPIRLGFLRKVVNKEKRKTLGWIAERIENENVE